MSGDQHATEELSSQSPVVQPSARELARAVDRLGEKDRELLSLVYRHRLTHAQAAMELGVPEAAVRVELLAVLRRVGMLVLATTEPR